jgi:uncharacterized 2Fe-2S/4Fe-4S cluster protein (DUF4445 family)
MAKETMLAIIDERGQREISVSSGSTLLEALRSAAFPHSETAKNKPIGGGRAGGASIESPCGGRGLCGKCRVRASGALAAPETRELSLLSSLELAEGWRLACLARIEGGAEGQVRVEFAALAAASILTEGPASEITPDPPARRVIVELEPVTLERQVADELRLVEALDRALGPAQRRTRVRALRELGELRDSPELAVLLAGAEILSVSGDVSPRPALGLGVDVGTTTLACYLIDLDTGRILGVSSALNDQRSFGADVISRIAATVERPDGLAELHGRIADQVTALALGLLGNVGAAPEDLLALTFAGNTTMMHLLAGIPPRAIAASPFPPVFTDTLSCPAPEIGLGLPATSTAWLLPGVAGYVGADIVAGMAALRMAETESLSLLLDIGTNGEIALGDSGGILCCATAAGPAFEGAGIEMGMGGVEGAVDAVWLDGEIVTITTIGGVEPRGLCGSGVLDALAVFLDAGLVDPSGRILETGELGGLPAPLLALRSEGPEGPRLAVGGRVYLSQRDIRNLQLAVSAIASGIDILVARSGRRIEDIERVYLAGGFGSFLDLKSALRVGLIPEALRDRVEVVGNSSGAGAVAACLSRERLAACDHVRSRSVYVELSSCPEFNEAFMEHLFFPEPA